MDKQRADGGRSRPFEKVSVFVLASREDRDVAAWLAHALQTCLRPPLGLGGVTASLAPQSLPKGGDYRAWLDSITADHAWLVVVASPTAADSRLIRSVLPRWWRARGMDRVLLALCGGQLAWDPANAGFDWRRSNALPRALGKRRDGSVLMTDDLFDAEPAWLDLSAVLDDLSAGLADPTVRTRIHSAIARIRGIELDALRREHAARRNRLLASLSAAAVTLLGFGLQQYLEVTKQSDSLQDDLQRSNVELEREQQGLEQDTALRVEAEVAVVETRERVEEARREVVRLDRGTELARDLAQYELLHGRLDSARREFEAEGWSSARNPFTTVRQDFVEALGTALPVDLSLWEIKRDRIALLTMFMASSGKNTAQRVSDDGRYAVGGSGRRRWRVDLFRGDFVRGSNDVDLLAEVGRSLHPTEISRGSFGLSDEAIAEFEARGLPANVRELLPPLKPGSQGIAVTAFRWTPETLYAATQEPGRSGLAFDLETGALVDEPYLSSDLLVDFGDTLFSAGFSGSKLYRRDRSPWRQLDLELEDVRGEAVMLGDGHLLRLGSGDVLDLLTGTRLESAGSLGDPSTTGHAPTARGGGLWSIDAQGRPTATGLGPLEQAHATLDDLRASALAPTPDGTWLCLGDPEGRIRLVDLSGGDVREVTELEGGVSAMRVLPTNDRVVVVRDRGQGPELLLVELNTGEGQPIESADGAPLRRVRLSQNGLLALIEFTDRTRAPRVRSLLDPDRTVDLIGAPGDRLGSAHFTSDGAHVFLGFESGDLELWDADLGQRTWRLDMPLEGPIAQVLASPEEDLIALVQERPPRLHLIDLWDLKRNRTYVSRSTNPYVYSADEPPGLEVFAELAYRQARLQNFDLAEPMAERAVEEGAGQANLVLAWAALERGEREAARVKLKLAASALSDDRLAVARWLSLLLHPDR